MQQEHQQKQTPNRRRQSGRNRNTPKQTTYASESDISKYKSKHVATPNTPATEPLQSLRASSTSQKQRNKSKKSKAPHSQDGAPSPDSKYQGRATPPLPIFAGSTFHASPAPSAFPIPSFFHREETASPGIKATSSPEQEVSCATTDTEDASTPSPHSISRAEESPLEFFFRADRAEKEKAKARRASSVHPSTKGFGSLSPPHESPSPKEFSTLPKAAVSNPARRPNHPKRTSAIGISADELDGNPGRPVGPAFSTPYQERMRAARSNVNSAQATPTPLRNQDTNSSDALKRYLFSGRLVSDEERPQQYRTQSEQSPQQDSPQARKVLQRFEPGHNQSPQHRLPRGMFPASVLTANAQGGQPSAPPVDAQLTSYRNEQIVAMEDGLRRMLKLDSSSHSMPLH
ncbi:hypothetical protein GGS26DRAFT_272179 [Hypomontagnella submonticulosa]|nr:hypothetical protein GGS26DRAFT_272179 [Hypomontagnella submonticulosa]